MEQFSQFLSVFDCTPAIVWEATRGVRDHKLAYYDTQVWAAARLNPISVLFNEDFAAGSTLEGVRFVNRLAPDFQIEAWI